jgi:single-stranded DNA-binding protein
MSYHKLIFVGNVGVSPKLYQGTTEYVRFSVASNRMVHNLDGTKEEVTIWFNVSKSGMGLQALLNNVTKGCKVLVEGQLVADKVSGHPKIFTNRAGEQDAAYEVAASTIQVLARPAQKEKPFVSNLMRTDYPDDYDKDDYDEEE